MRHSLFVTSHSKSGRCMVDSMWQVYQNVWERKTYTTTDKRDKYTDGDISRCKFLMDLVQRHNKVLDIGCGNGMFRGRRAKDVGITYIHSDNDTIGIDPVVTTYEDRFPIIRGFSEELPFHNELFDCVVARSILDHVRDPERTIAEAWRVLRRGGRFIGEVALFVPPYGQHNHIRSLTFDITYMLLAKRFDVAGHTFGERGNPYCYFIWNGVKA